MTVSTRKNMVSCVSKPALIALFGLLCLSSLHHEPAQKTRISSFPARMIVVQTGNPYIIKRTDSQLSSGYRNGGGMLSIAMAVAAEHGDEEEQESPEADRRSMETFTPTTGDESAFVNVEQTTETEPGRQQPHETSEPSATEVVERKETKQEQHADEDSLSPSSSNAVPQTYPMSASPRLAEQQEDLTAKETGNYGGEPAALEETTRETAEGSKKPPSATSPAAASSSTSSEMKSTDDDDDEEPGQGLQELPKLSLKEYKAQLKQQQREAEGNLVDINNVKGNPPESPVNIVAEEEMSDENSADSSKPDFASQAAGAVILAKNQEAKGAKNLLVDDKDAYCMAPCDKPKFVVIGLSEDIIVDTVVLANYERYSSSIKDFLILGSQRYPTNEWVLLGNFTAEDIYGEQTFSVSANPWTRYIKLVWLSHYGNEFYCTLTSLQVHGYTIMEDFSAEMQKDEETEKMKQAVSGSAEEKQQVPSATHIVPSPSAAEIRKDSGVIYESKQRSEYQISSSATLRPVRATNVDSSSNDTANASVIGNGTITLSKGSATPCTEAVHLPQNVVVLAALNFKSENDTSTSVADEDVLSLPTHQQPIECANASGINDSFVATYEHQNDSEPNGKNGNVTVHSLYSKGWLYYIRGMYGLCFFNHDKNMVPAAERSCLLWDIPSYSCMGKSHVSHPRQETSSLLRGELRLNTSGSSFENTEEEALNPERRKCPVPRHLPLIGYYVYSVFSGNCTLRPIRYFEKLNITFPCCPVGIAAVESHEIVLTNDTNPLRCCSSSQKDWCCARQRWSVDKIALGNDGCDRNGTNCSSLDRPLLNETEELYFIADNHSVVRNATDTNESTDPDPFLDSSGNPFLDKQEFVDALTDEGIDGSLKSQPKAFPNMKSTSGNSVFKALTSKLKELALEQQIMDEYLDNWQKQYEKVIQNYGIRLDKHRNQLQSSKANHSVIREQLGEALNEIKTLHNRLQVFEETCHSEKIVSDFELKLTRYLGLAAFLFAAICAVVCAYMAVVLRKCYLDSDKATKESIRQIGEFRQQMDGLQHGHELRGGYECRLSAQSKSIDYDKGIGKRAASTGSLNTNEGNLTKGFMDRRNETYSKGDFGTMEDRRLESDRNMYGAVNGGRCNGH